MVSSPVELLITQANMDYLLANPALQGENLYMMPKGADQADPEAIKRVWHTRYQERSSISSYGSINRPL